MKKFILTSLFVFLCVSPAFSEVYHDGVEQAELGTVSINNTLTVARDLTAEGIIYTDQLSPVSGAEITITDPTQPNSGLVVDPFTSGGFTELRPSGSGNSFIIPAGIYFGFSTSQMARMGYVVTGNDNFQLGVKTGSATQSGVAGLMELDDMGNANRSPGSTSNDPVWRVYSSDAGEADDYIQMLHNQTTALLQNGQGNMSIDSASTIILDASTGQIAFQQAGGATNFNIISSNSQDQTLFAMEDGGGNQIVLTNDNNGSKDHDHATTTDPTLFGHSDTDPDTANDEWWSLTHDKTNAVFGLGSGTLVISSLPTSDPGVAGGLWNNSGVVNVSSG